MGQLPPGRLFTPTEARIIKIILQVFFRSFKEAWAPVTPIEFEHVSSEINPQFAQIADENDLVVLSRFESDANSQGQGFIDMVIPYVALKPVRDVLRSRVQTGDGNEESDKVWRSQLADAGLAARVRDFQLQHDLPGDGIAGPLTLIRLAQAGNPDSPHLSATAPVTIRRE